MLKMIVLPENLTLKRLGIDDSEVNRFDIGSSKEIARKLGKLKSQNLFKSRNLKGEK